MSKVDSSGVTATFICSETNIQIKSPSLSCVCAHLAEGITKRSLRVTNNSCRYYNSPEICKTIRYWSAIFIIIYVQFIQVSKLTWLWTLV